MIGMPWVPNQRNLVTFILADANGDEVTGLDDAFTLVIGKAGGALVAGAGDKAEMGNGWYSYLATVAEADTPGPVSLSITGAGVKQQNLEYVVLERTVTAVPFTYTLTNSATLLPIEAAKIQFCVSNDGSGVVWTGYTDAFGVARDAAGNLPRLDPGTYYVFRTKQGFTFSDPDIEVVDG